MKIITITVRLFLAQRLTDPQAARREQESDEEVDEGIMLQLERTA